ncbi:MAG: autotransporter outer membrane beta-barrel domain-containing protein [Bacteroidota bacterium]
MKTIKLILVCLGLALIMASAKAQQSEGIPIRVSYNLPLYKTNFGKYDIKVDNELERIDQGGSDYRIAVAYLPSPRWGIGISYLRNINRENISYRDNALGGQTVLEPNSGRPLTYSRTEIWQRVNDYHIGAFATYDIVQRDGFYLRALLGYNHIIMRHEISQYQSFEGYFGGDETRTESNRTLSALEGGLKLGYQIAPGVGFSVGGRFIQNLPPLESNSTLPDLPREELRYANLEFGVDLQVMPMEKQDRPNTIMLGVGFPFSLSYERLLAANRVRHSLRVFYDQFGVYEGAPGMAYNLKLGKDKNFFLIEPGIYFAGETLYGGQIGYEYRGDAGVVMRLDGGLMASQYDLLPRIQAHVGYAF